LKIALCSSESLPIEIHNLFVEQFYGSAGCITSIDCPQFPVGMYFVSIAANVSTLNRKLIIAR